MLTKLTVKVRYGKVLFCGVAGAGKTQFFNLLMKEKFNEKHISTELCKPQQVVFKVQSSDSDKEIEFEKMNIDNEIKQLYSYLKQNHATSAPSPQSSITSNQNIAQAQSLETEPTSEESKSLSLINNFKSKNTSDMKPPGKVWDILTFMDTGGQPQFISMLPAVNSFAMITFVAHKITKGGKESLNEIVKVPYGYKEGKITHSLHPHRHTHLQIIETLISYASTILLPDTEFLDKLKVNTIEATGSDNKRSISGSDNKRSILLVGTHSGDDELSENDIAHIDKEMKKEIKQSGENCIKPKLNKHYHYLVPVDNKKQITSSDSETNNTKKFTNPSTIRGYIRKILWKQDDVDVPIHWLLLELEIRKVCEGRKCNFISYNEAMKIAKDKRFCYAYKFPNGDEFDHDEFIKQGLRFHHLFGVLLHFENVEGMCELIITNPQWLFNKLTKIVEHFFIDEDDYECDKVLDREDFEVRGIFKKSLLDKAWFDNDFKEFKMDSKSDPKDSFLKLLEYLRIAVPSSDDSDSYFMPCILRSCDPNESNQIPDFDVEKTQPFTIQFESRDGNTFSFPRGSFCSMVVDLMVMSEWKQVRQAYVNLLTFHKRNTGHHITLVDRIFCLEVYVTHKQENISVHKDIFETVSQSLLRVAGQLKIYKHLSCGFPCKSCQSKGVFQIIQMKNIDHLHDNYCDCNNNHQTTLSDSHRAWLHAFQGTKICTYINTYVCIHMCMEISTNCISLAVNIWLYLQLKSY